MSRPSIDYYTRVREIVASQIPTRGSRLLDVGTGSGQEVEFWARHVADVIAIDRKMDNVRQTRDRLRAAGLDQRVYPCVADVERLPFTSASINVVYAQSVLMYTNKAGSLSEMSRVLRNNGRLVLVENTRGNPIVALGRRATHFHSYVDYVTEEDIAGFGLARKWRMRVSSFHVLVPIVRWLQLAPMGAGFANRMLPLLERVDARLLRAWPTLSRFSWVKVYVLQA